MKYAIIFALLVSFSPLAACEMESDLDAIANQGTTLVNAFSNFTDSLVALLCEKTAQAKIIFHNLVHSIVEISQFLGTKSISPNGEQNPNFFKTINEQTLGQLTDIALVQAQSVSMIKARPTNEQLKAKHKADVQKILNFFAGIVQNFLKIVQAPENKDNVAQGVIGMLSNIVAAGNTIIKDSQQNVAPGATVGQVVDAMDKETKQQILDLIQSRRQLVRINE